MKLGKRQSKTRIREAQAYLLQLKKYVRLGGSCDEMDSISWELGIKEF
jgi:hypothetical protein